MKLPTIEEMVDKIYETMSDKTLSFGCRIEYENHSIYRNRSVLEKGVVIHTSDRRGGGIQGQDQWVGQFVITYQSANGINTIGFGRGQTIENIGGKIIGHTVVLGDVCRYVATLPKPKGGYFRLLEKIIAEREDGNPDNLSKAIEEQSDVCKKLVYSLIPTDGR